MNLDNIRTFLLQLFSFNEAYPLLFTQFYFWAFFAIVFAFFALLKNKTLLRNSYLFFVSLFFYYKTSGSFVAILLIITLLGYFLARGIAASSRNGTRKFLLITGVILNLFVLFYFKYAYFLVDAVNTLFHTHFEVVNYFAVWTNALTASTRFDVSKILLPVGISFYIFQSISYLVDVFRKQVAPITNILNFGFYVSFFPGLVAGPIIRANQFVPQLYKPYFLSRRQFGIAIFWILNGLFKKIIMSDYLAVNFVDRVFDNPVLFTPFENLSALFIYSLQVYADFSGYTDIAIGVAMLMGFYLPQNFNSPYKATNAGNFWKRWHISLSNWLKDYLYIPLGGNRKATVATYLIIVFLCLVAILVSGSVLLAYILAAIALILITIAIAFPVARKKIHTNINNMDTMLLGGFWHGASWNFIIWGGLNGLGILIYKFWKGLSSHWRIVAALVPFATCVMLNLFVPAPIWRIGCVWCGTILGGTIIRYLWTWRHPQIEMCTVGTAWGILQTFVFISFTRLFFRSGSNLDPAIANQTAWNTAKTMVAQIGSSWDFSLIPEIITTYRFVFLMFAAGMIIHWLPDTWKRRYRYRFARLPFWLIITTMTLSVFVLYQFITADLQPFIYFQF